MLNVNKVSKSFGDHRVLSDISLTIDKSQIVGLAGSSGSGKSTLLRLMQKLETPDCGSITSLGRTGFMFQDFQLFPHFTVWQNIIYAPALHKSANYVERAKEFIELLGLSAKTDAYPGQLSGGQKQRVALARALMTHPTPDILFCDEPTSGLDVATTNDVSVLLGSVKALNIGMVIASHDLEFLTSIADIIFVLKHGRLQDPLYPKISASPIDDLRNRL